MLLGTPKPGDGGRGAVTDPPSPRLPPSPGYGQDGAKMQQRSAAKPQRKTESPQRNAKITKEQTT
jgi:hypothetical protein